MEQLARRQAVVGLEHVWGLGPWLSSGGTVRGSVIVLVLTCREGRLKGQAEVTPPNMGPWVRCFLKSSVLGNALWCSIVALVATFVAISTNSK